jgi:hypothetical protein
MEWDSCYSEEVIVNKFDLDDVINNLHNKVIDRSYFSFDVKKQILFDYCDEYKKTPKNKIIIGKWLGNQKSKINLKTDQMYLDLSSNKYVKESLDNYYLKNKKVEKITMSKEEKKKLLFDYYNKYKKLLHKK